MALGLNIVVGFAGLLDLGYVAFYAFGAYTIGWFASDHFAYINGEKGIHIGVGDFASTLPGIHLNFLLILVVAAMHLRGGRRDHRPADAAAARRLHRDRHARLRRDHLPLRGQRRLDRDRRQLQAHRTAARRSRRSTRSSCRSSSEFDSAFNLRPFYWFALGAGRARAVRATSACATRGSAAPGSRSARTRSRPRQMGVPLVQDEADGVRDGRRVRRDGRRLPRLLPHSVNANKFQFGVLDLRAGDDHPRRARVDLGGGRWGR